ncbi:MAG TPA: hypothetical protein PLZ36_08185 [Armatimonadota bacterium]|nr:hypothetical protein [Armatimonadota bacterium]HOS42760.1 hypothetical protein [Armatimonadota bacterium]
MMARWGALLVLAVLLAGCGSGSLTGPAAAPIAPEAQVLVGERALELDFAVFGPLTGDFTGAEGTLAEQVAADCATAGWLPYWQAALAGAGLTATRNGVTATAALAPLADDPRDHYAVTLTLNGLDEESGQGYANVTVLTGRLGVTAAEPRAVSLTLTPAAAPETAITVEHDLATRERVIAVTAARLRTRTVLTLTAAGTVERADCAVYAREAAGERLRRTMHFHAGNEVLPAVAAGMRLACFIYDPSLGDAAADNLCYVLLLREEGTGLQRRFSRLLGAWREEPVTLGG